MRSIRYHLKRIQQNDFFRPMGPTWTTVWSSKEHKTPAIKQFKIYISDKKIVYIFRESLIIETISYIKVVFWLFNNQVICSSCIVKMVLQYQQNHCSAPQIRILCLIYIQIAISLIFLDSDFQNLIH